MKILVTGGLGYIGSHTCVALLDQGIEVHIIDNLSNSSIAVLECIQKISLRSPVVNVADIRSSSDLKQVFDEERFDAVMHFAGLKSAADSVRSPLDYYDTNVAGTINLLRVMNKVGLKRLIFSSSAALYGGSQEPLHEGSNLAPSSPYGRSKLHVESILADLAASDPGWRIACLRYFNAAGAHPSGQLGERPCGVPSSLMASLAQVASGQMESLTVFGDSWPTPDGTAIRDYIHVMDLAEAHVEALRLLEGGRGMGALNLGTGRGHSVLEVVSAYSRACGKSIPWRFVARRPGDVERCVADPSAANRILGWRATRNLDAMCADSWRWQQRVT